MKACSPTICASEPNSVAWCTMSPGKPGLSRLPGGTRHPCAVQLRIPSLVPSASSAAFLKVRSDTRTLRTSSMAASATLVLTGARGNLGGKLAAALRPQYALRCLDLRGGGDCIAADLAIFD